MPKNDAQIEEYKSLREEHLKNMEMRGTLTNIMVAALAAVIGLGSWSNNAHTSNAFYIFFFVPGLVAGWALVIYHSYRVFREIHNYLAKLEQTLGMHWDEQNPPHPTAPLGYAAVLLGGILTSMYFLNVVPQPDDIAGVCVFSGSWRPCFPVSTLWFGWMIWLAGVVASGIMFMVLVSLWLQFRQKKKEEMKETREPVLGSQVKHHR